MPNEACEHWLHGDCEGTEACPPRCPRHFDDDGRAYVVHPMDASDHEDLVGMYLDYPDEHRSMAVPPRVEPRIREWLDGLTANGRNFLANHDDRVVGHAAYAPVDADAPEMLVYVDPDYHGRGLGTELTKHVLAYAADDDCDAIELDVDRDNAAAIHVYRDLGFTATDRTPMELSMALHTDANVVLRVQRPPAERDVPGPSDR